MKNSGTSTIIPNVTRPFGNISLLSKAYSSNVGIISFNLVNKSYVEMVLNGKQVLQVMTIDKAIEWVNSNKDDTRTS